VLGRTPKSSVSGVILKLVVRPAKLSARTFCTFRRELSSLRPPSHGGGRPQYRREVERRERTADDHPYDDYRARPAALRPSASGSRARHRGRDHRHGSRGSSLDGPWLLREAPNVVVTLDVTNLTTSELQQQVLALRRRVRKLTALLRLALALLRSSGFTLTHERLPDGRAKIRILRAVDRAREFVPLRALVRFLRLSPSRFHAWRRLQHACALDDQSSCPHRSPHRLTPREILAIKDMVTAVEYRHVPTGTLAVLAQRLAEVWASPSTWYHLVRKFGWRRPRLRVHPAKPKVGVRTTRAN